MKYMCRNRQVLKIKNLALDTEKALNENNKEAAEKSYLKAKEQVKLFNDLWKINNKQ